MPGVRPIRPAGMRCSRGALGLVPRVLASASSEIPLQVTFLVGPLPLGCETVVMRRLNLNILLVLIPVAFGLYWYGADPLLVFAIAALTILPLSKVVGSSTETLGYYLGPTAGGLLNASMGNAPELHHRRLCAQARAGASRQGVADGLDTRQSALDAWAGNVCRRDALLDPEIQRARSQAVDVDDVPGGCGAHGSGSFSFHVGLDRARNQSPDRRSLAGCLCAQLVVHAGDAPEAFRDQAAGRAECWQDLVVEGGALGI